jgi:hypothetical protein
VNYKFGRAGIDDADRFHFLAFHSPILPPVGNFG